MFCYREGNISNIKRYQKVEVLSFLPFSSPIEEVSCNRGNPGLGGYTLEMSQQSLFSM